MAAIVPRFQLPAVKSFREFYGGKLFPYAFRAEKQVGVGNTIMFKGLGNNLLGLILAQDTGEGHGRYI